MFGLSRRERRDRKFRQVFMAAWDRTADRMIPLWPTEFREELRREALESFAAFCGHDSDHRLAVRFSLAAYTLVFTRYELLLIPVPPGEDQTGARDGRLVTGEVRSRLDEILKNPKSLSVLGFDEPPRFHDPYNFCLVRYQISYTLAGAYNVLRALTEPSDHPDWHVGCRAILYAYWEHEFRVALGMPSALDDGFLRPLRYSAIVDFIRDGWPNPHQRWLDTMSDDSFRR